MHAQLIISDSSAPEVLPQEAYGWGEYFNLRSPLAKTRFLCTAVLSNLPPLQEEIQRHILRGLFPEFGDKLSPASVLRSGSPTQSNVSALASWALPHEANAAEQHLNLDYIRDLHRFLMQESISIQLVGPDNPPAGLPVMTEVTLPRTRARPDTPLLRGRNERDGWFTLYREDTGQTIPVTFSATKPYSIGSPESIELQIADTKDTAFVFQNIIAILPVLQSQRVFEITLLEEAVRHPDIDAIIDILRQFGFAVSLESPRYREHGRLRECLVPVPSNREVRRMADILRSDRHSGPKGHIVIPVDRVTRQTAARLLQQAWQHHLPFCLSGASAPVWLRTLLAQEDLPAFSAHRSLLPSLRPAFQDLLLIPSRLRGCDGTHCRFINALQLQQGPTADGRLAAFTPDNLAEQIQSAYDR